MVLLEFRTRRLTRPGPMMKLLAAFDSSVTSIGMPVVQEEPSYAD